MGTLNGDFGAHGSYTLGLNSAMSIMGQEAGHRWLAFPVFFPPSSDFSDLFDLLGREVATLTDGYRDVGNHMVSWDASEMASGIYLYVLRAGENTIGGKMVLMK